MVRFRAFIIGLLVSLIHFTQFLREVSAQQPRTAQRLINSFEGPDELHKLSRGLDQVDLIPVLDNGVTAGKQCGRITVPKGADYGVMELDQASIRNWREFDYLAIDLYTEDSHKYPFVLELWDKSSRNYATRCTWEEITTRPGKQTLLYPIHRARRNGKEGREWSELEAADKIDLNGLTKVKLFVSPLESRNAVFWIDNIRLLQEDAAKPKITLNLPAGAIAFNFGSPGAQVPGFLTVTAESRYSSPRTYGFTGNAPLNHVGNGWPDLLGGTFILTPDSSEKLEFYARIPKGNYHYWMIAGPIYRREPQSFQWSLTLNNQQLVQQHPSPEEYYSEKFLFRFLTTQYSKKREALWTSYLQSMYPVWTGELEVPKGELRVSTQNHFVSALVLLPVSPELDFPKFVASTEKVRRQSFLTTLGDVTPPEPSPKQTSIQAPELGYSIFIPDRATVVEATLNPTLPLKTPPEIKLAGAPSENLVLRFAIRPDQDLGPCRVSLSDFKSDSGKTLTLSDSNIYFQNYRYDGRDYGEMGLIPTPVWNMEAGVTQACWIWCTVPGNALPGTFRAQIQFQPKTSRAMVFPVEIEVYPFKLESTLPVAYGLYYVPRTAPGLSTAQVREMRLNQFQFMRRIGLTSVSVGSPSVTRLRPNGQVELKFDPELFELAREAQLGRSKGQFLMATALGIGRAIGRRLPGSEGAEVDRNPGIELRQPEFQTYFKNAMQQYQEFLTEQKMPVAVEVVDEPREIPNPWNRNLADTIQYANFLRQAGMTTFITPMSDQNEGKDYTILADYTDILSVHAWPASEGLINRARKQKLRMWMYNTGMDRFTWGFYPWSQGVTGRWEWHFCWPDKPANGEYPGEEWFNPFTGSHGYVPDVPLGKEFVFQPSLLDVSEGIRDYTYLISLEKKLDSARKVSQLTQQVKTADELLTRIRKQIPKFPPLRGLSDHAGGALIGQGTAAEFQQRSATWRREVAEALIRLQSNKK